MKTKLLLSTMALIALIMQPAFALHGKPDFKGNRYEARYMNFQPIMFVENNVEFMVYPDGTVDFQSLTYNDSRVTQYGRRSVKNQNIRAKTINSVYYNEYGDIALVEGIPLEYDRIGRIRLIGNTPIEYNRGNGWVKRVGQLQVNYKGNGEIAHMRGFVNSYNRDFHYTHFRKNYKKGYAQSRRGAQNYTTTVAVRNRR